jgi:hypothetical protein
MDITHTKTKRGKTVTCDVYWDGEFKIYYKNHQPITHSCIHTNKKEKKR